MSRHYQSFDEFYPFYLSQHCKPLTRGLHYTGTSLVIVLLLWALLSGHYLLLLFLPFCGYSFSWVGHFFVEKNRPATFTYPWFSLRGDFLMLFEALTGRLDHRCFNQDQRVS